MKYDNYITGIKFWKQKIYLYIYIYTEWKYKKTFIFHIKILLIRIAFKLESTNIYWLYC